MNIFQTPKQKANYMIRKRDRWVEILESLKDNEVNFKNVCEKQILKSENEIKKLKLKSPEDFLI